MADFFAMHGYGMYVWTAYGVFFVVLLADALAPLHQRRHTLAQIRSRLQREAARNAASSGEQPGNQS
ncbi:MAG: heme exporter protein CcmD [Rudaea sp.]|nr:heme exporter protein CcmD [Rudaea sp.]